MKNHRSLLIIALLLLLTMSCKFLAPPASVPATPSSPVQAIPTHSLPATAAPSLTTESASSPIPATSTVAATVTDVTNTHWVGRIYDEKNNLIWEVFEIIFLPDGKLRYYVPNAWYEDGTWQQKEDDITLEWGNHACDFYGVLYGDTIAGARKCTDGKTWGWWVQLQTP